MTPTITKESNKESTGTIKVTAVGGYGEIGRNMTLITVDDESIILDMGVHLDRLLNYTQDDDLGKFSAKELIENDVIPNDTVIKHKNQVKAIIPSHGHLDHIAAIPYLEKHYNCPIICTPYTAEVVYRQFKDNKFRQLNDIIAVPPNSKKKIGTKFEVEFIAMTHSIPQTAMLFIHTPYGTVVYANDFKLDLHPVLGSPPDFKRIDAASKNVKVLISECLRAHHAGRTPSEQVAKQMLQDIMIGTDTTGCGIFFTTFSSHIERLQTLIALAKVLKRKVIFFGRSMEKYSTSAKRAGISNIIDQVEIVQYRSFVKKRLRMLMGQDKSKYIIVMTGHQGEKHAVLYSMLNGKLPCPFAKNDLFIFSCNVIPTAAIQEARIVVEEKLLQKGVRMFKDIHVSGHASREDLRDLLRHVKPQHVIPAHGTLQMMKSYQEIAEQEGYIKDKNIHFLNSGESHEFK